MTNLPVWIHVGLAKTGTTCLQRCVFSQHAEIIYLGKEIDENYVVSHPLYHVARQPARNFDLKATRAAFAAMIESGQRVTFGKRICLLSEEGLTGYRALDPAVCASRARELFPGAHILLVLREPVEWLQSMYFFRLSLRFPETLDGFNRWLETSLARSAVGTDIGVLHIGTIARTWTKLFGRSKVTIMQYEKFRADPTGFVSEICEKIGVDRAEGVRLYNKDNKFAKSRITKRQQEFCTSFKLARDGHYSEYISSVYPVLETGSKKLRDAAISLLPPDMSAERGAVERQLLTFSRFVDRAARRFLQEGEPANAEPGGALRARIARMVEPGLGYIASEFGIRTQHYIDSIRPRTA